MSAPEANPGMSSAHQQASEELASVAGVSIPGDALTASLLRAAELEATLEAMRRALEEIERLYWEEGKDATWRAAQMQAVARQFLATPSTDHLSALLAEAERRGAQKELTYLRRRIETWSNDILVEMEPDYDDSITGFNEAMDLVSKEFASAILALQPTAQGGKP